MLPQGDFANVQLSRIGSAAAREANVRHCMPARLDNSGRALIVVAVPYRDASIASDG